jgi:(E)-4-hydroxy-3-methylbut-2-enyl-diphosphate synthase
MGCVVNGPGEAGDADFGIAGGVGEAVFFRRGKIVCKIPEEKIIETLLAELEQYK